METESMQVNLSLITWLDVITKSNLFEELQVLILCSHDPTVTPQSHGQFYVSK